MVHRETLFLVLVVLVSIAVGVLVGISLPYPILGILPALGLLLFALVLLGVRDHSISMAKLNPCHDHQMWRGKGPRYVDETIEIPPKGSKDYPVKLWQGFSLSIRAMSFSDNILSVEIVDSSGVQKDDLVIEKRMLQSKVVTLKFEPDHEGTWTIKVRNLDDTPTKVGVVIHLFGPPHDWDQRTTYVLEHCL